MSKKIEISFPQIVFERKEVEVTEDQYEELIESCSIERGDFIWSKMTDLEKEHTLGDKWVKSFISDGMCDINTLKL